MVKKGFLEGFIYLELLNYINSRLLVNEFVCADISDLYTEYLRYVYNSEEFQNQKQKNEWNINSVDEFVNQGKENTFKHPGVISRRQFGGVLEKVLSQEHSYVKRKQRKVLVLQGVGLKEPIKKLLTA
jgi:hypothetical protein